MRVRVATAADYGEVFSLQRAAFVDEARLYETPDVPALSETLDECVARLDSSTTWVAVDGHRIVGAVSMRRYRGAPDVERLMVAPDRRGEGVAILLLDALAAHARAGGERLLQLIVGAVAIDNQAIYRHLGWEQVSTSPLDGHPTVLLHTMQKHIDAK